MDYLVDLMQELIGTFPAAGGPDLVLWVCGFLLLLFLLRSSFSVISAVLKFMGDW